MKKKIAIMADIHGNYSALEAVLKDIEQNERIEHIYCLGDLIGIGYQTNEVLEMMYARPHTSFVMGNHDEVIIDIIAGREPYSKGSERKHHEWIAARLDHKFIPFLSVIPTEIRTIINGKMLLFHHYHLNDQGNFSSVDYRPTGDKLDEIYQGSDAELVCFGHHHIVHFFKTKDRLYFNPGSLGCYHKPLASYAILMLGDHGEMNITLKEVPYDNKEFLLGYKRLRVPDSDYILKIFHGNQHLKL